MAENRNSRDEKLIQELYDKLKWFTFEATDEEFDPDQVETILDLLDKLDPLPEMTVPGGSIGQGQNGAGADKAPMSNAEAAFERFKAKYNITEEDLARKNGGSAAETNAEGEKNAPFPAEFSKELAFDRVQARALAGGIGRRAEARVGSALADGRPVTEAAGDAASPSGKARKTWFGRFLSTGWGKVAAAFVIVLVASGVSTVGTSAVKQKSFFEIVKNGVNSMRITVTGNEMGNETVSMELDSNDKVYYDSWTEVKEEVPEILIPEYIPDGVSLKEIYRSDMGNYILFQGLYTDSDTNELLIRIEEFSKKYAGMELTIDEEWVLLDVVDNIEYYQYGKRYKGFMKEGRCIYEVEWIDLDQIEKIYNMIK